MATWKNTERKVAAMTGGQRIGPTGRNTEDVGHELLSIEVKHRKSLPAWLTGAYLQAKHNAPTGKVPLVVLHQLHSREYLAVLPLVELVKLLAKGEESRAHTLDVT